MKFFIADAFSKEHFGGNPAGVVIIPDGADFPEDKTMLSVATELRYSETAFVKRVDENTFQTRYFTPVDEVDLCGHATIATFFCLRDISSIEAGETSCINLTRAGDIKISFKDDEVFMGMASPKKIATIEDKGELEKLYSIMGTEYGTVEISCKGETKRIIPEIISTGLPDIMLPLGSLKKLQSLKPDMDKLADISKAYNVTGVHAFALPLCEENENVGTTGLHVADIKNGINKKEFDSRTSMRTKKVHTRNFAPLYGIDEEAATGTASGALAYYMQIHEMLDDADKIRMIQGETMNRPSEITVEINGSKNSEQSDEKIMVGGGVSILAKGEINI